MSTSTKVTMFGTVACLPGRGDEMAAVLRRMVEAAKDEPGVEVYTYTRAAEEAFCFFALMSDVESMEAHGQTPAMQEAVADFGPLMASPPQMTSSAPLAAVGLDL